MYTGIIAKKGYHRPVQINKKHAWKLALGTLAVLVILITFLVKQDIRFGEIWETFSRLQLKFICLALLLNLLQGFFWILRPWPLVPKYSHLKLTLLAKAISVGQFLNSFLPARAGDVAKVYLLSDKNSSSRLSPSSVIGVLATDKLLDLLSVLLLAILSGATQVEGGLKPPGLSMLYGVLIGIPLLWILFRILPQPIKDKLKRWGRDFLKGLKPLFSPRAGISSFLLATAVWISEALAIQMVFYSANLPLNFGQSIYVMCIVNLGIMIPISVANVGAFEAAFALGLSKFGIGLTEALALALAHHSLQALSMAIWAVSTLRLGGKVKLDIRI